MYVKTVLLLHFPLLETPKKDWEYCFQDRTAWNHTKNMVAFESVSDGSPANVHHFVLYGYDTDGCQDPGSTGSTENIVWVGGIGFYEDLPTGVGISFSRVRSFRLQVHYDNPTGASGLKDNSGVRIWLSATAPTHEAGTLQLGDGTTQLTGTNIATGKSYYTFTCPAAVTSAWPHDITVFASILHMHQQGDAMYTEIRDGTTGQVAKHANAVQYFDFDWQDPTLVQPYQIKRGDSATTRCYFNNDVGTAASPLKFGLGSDEEMCIDFLYYYPYNANIKQHCTFGHGGNFGGSMDDSGVATTTTADFRTFAINAGTASDPTCSSTAATLELAAAGATTGATTTGSTTNNESQQQLGGAPSAKVAGGGLALMAVATLALAVAQQQ